MFFGPIQVSGFVCGFETKNGPTCNHWAKRLVTEELGHAYKVMFPNEKHAIIFVACSSVVAS